MLENLKKRRMISCVLVMARQFKTTEPSPSMFVTGANVYVWYAISP